MNGKVVVLAASACSSARILLNSKSKQHPNGLGNSSDLIGKYLHDSTGGDMMAFIPELIDRKILLNRLERIQEKLFNHQTEMNKSLENNIIDVLVENETEESGKFFGRSEYMTSVIFNANDESVGKVVKVKINKSNQNTLFGEIVKKPKLKVA